jgi:uncharacterized protein with ParB-like and HNH nuclease domain
MLNAGERFKADSLSVLELFSGASYEIPAFQRDYAWTKEQIDQLWQDIVNCSKSEHSAHFLGPMVVIPTGKQVNDFLVVDGQQRLTTLQILISLIRDRWVELDPGKKETDDGPKDFEELSRALLSSGATNNYKKTFTPNLHIMHIFADYIRREPKADPHRKFVSKLSDVSDLDLEHGEELLAAYIQLKKKLSNFNAADLLKFENTLYFNFLILRINALEEANAFLLFDTLNNRGLDLTQGDLIKNYVFQAAGEQNLSSPSQGTQNLLSKWDSIVEKVGLDKLDNFLRYFLIMETQMKVQREEISKIVKDRYKTQVEIQRFLEDLAINADNFALLDRSDLFTGKYKDELNAIFSDLADLKQSTQAIILLSAMRKFKQFDSKSDYENLMKICRAVEIFSYRARICTKNAQDIENLWKDCSVILSSETLDPQEILDKVVTKLRDESPSDAEFESNLSSYAFKESRFARYALSKFEHYRKANDAWILAGSSKLDVEHVAPKTPDENFNWRVQMKGDLIYRNVITLLGNQVLLQIPLNRKIKNKEFSVKKKEYIKQSEKLLYLAKEVSKANTWNQNEVVNRSKNLAHEALKIWNWNSLSLPVHFEEPIKKGRAPRKKVAAKRN